MMGRNDGWGGKPGKEKCPKLGENMVWWRTEKCSVKPEFWVSRRSENLDDHITVSFILC